MRHWVLRIHLYLGLLCSSYLILFGVSSLNFNHPFAFTNPGTGTVSWERSIELPPAAGDTSEEAKSVQAALGLSGWTLPWETRREANGDLRFGLSRPGKHYTIRVLRQARSVQVEEQRKGYWTVVRELHGLMQVPGSRLAAAWGWYTDLCTWVVVFAAVSGVYLFTARRRERRVGWAVLGLATGCSALFMLYLRLWA
jgi:hypothetical protein